MLCPCLATPCPAPQYKQKFSIFHPCIQLGKKNLPPPEIIWGPLGSQSPVREPLVYEEEVVVDSLTDFPAACNVLIPNVKRVRYIPQSVGLPVDINDTVFHSYYICNQQIVNVYKRPSHPLNAKGCHKCIVNNQLIVTLGISVTLCHA